MAIIAIIVCAILAIVSIAVFLFLWLGGRNDEPATVEVPKLVGENYYTVNVPDDFHMVLLEEVFDENSAAGTILKQDPKAGTLVGNDIEDKKVFVTVSMGAEPKVGVMSDLTDYPQVFAEANIDKMEMELKIIIEEEYSETIEAGKVTRTEPEAGTPLEVGQTITLYISLGKEIKTGAMPNVIDVSQKDAEATLERQELDLEVVIEEIYDSDIEKGNVIKTKPEKGEPLKTGQTVTLYISKGPELKEMPNMVGKDLATAKDLLRYAGFSEPTVEEVYDDAKSGTVLEQSHTAGKQVDVTETVKLKVSKGPEPTEPPTEPPVVTITKDVTIELKGRADEGACSVQIICDTQVIYDETVEQGTASIVLKSQTGSEIVKYTVIVNETDTWDEMVDFTS